MSARKPRVTAAQKKAQEAEAKLKADAEAAAAAAPAPVAKPEPVAKAEAPVAASVVAPASSNEASTPAATSNATPGVRKLSETPSENLSFAEKAQLAAEKKKSRAERFGLPVNAAPEPRKRTAPGDVVPSTAGRNKLARMGLPVKGTAQAEKVEQLGAKFAEEDEKKRQRAIRFGSLTVDSEEEEKRKKRLERFAAKSTATA